MTLNIIPSKGLFLNSSSMNPEGIPAGTCEVAHNISITRDGLVTKRRGFTRRYLTENVIDYILTYQGNNFIVEDNTLSRLAADFTVAHTYNTFNISSNVKHAESNNNLYLSGDDRVLKLDGINGSLKNAGILKALDISVNLSGVAGIVPANSQAAYRVVFAYEDKNNNKIVSAPSNLISIVNSVVESQCSISTLTVTVSATAHGLVTGNNITVTSAFDNNSNPVNVSGDYTIERINDNSFKFDLLNAPTGSPSRLSWGTRKTATIEAILSSDVKDGYTYQIYRSSFSVDASVEALEDLQLVDEITITADDITEGSVTYIDEIPQQLRQGFLYTNPAQEGIVAANEPPPSAKNIAFFKNCMFYANVKEPARRRFTLVTVNDINIGDEFRIKIGDTTHTFTAAVVEDSSINQFKLTNTLSVSINIDETARSLARVINRSNINIACYYLSSVNDTPGQLLLESLDYSIDKFILNTNVAEFSDCFSPAIPISGDDSYFGETETNTNKIMFSKILEPEAVPLANFLTVGNKSESIIALQALRDSLIVLTDRAIYRVSGETPSEFFVRTIDNSTRCVASKSVAILNDNVLFLSDRGICSVNENNVQVISNNINPLIINALERPTVENAVGFAYAADETYYISMLKENPRDSDDVICYVYDAKQGTWVSSDTVYSNRTFTDDRLILVSMDKTSVLQERKDRLATDFADSLNEVVTIISKQSDFVIVIDTLNVEIGDALFSNEEYLIVSNVLERVGDTSRVRVTSLIESEVGTTFRLDKKITSLITTSPIYLNAIQINKKITEMQLQFRNDDSCTNMQVSYTNDITQTKQQELGFTALLGWGLEAWSLSKWGSLSNLDRDYYTSISTLFRSLIPRECIRSRFIQVRLEHSRVESIDLQNINLKVVGTSGSRKGR